MTEKQMHTLPLNRFSLEDGFWKNYMELIRTRVIPYQWKALNDQIEGAEPSYSVQNFKIAAGQIKGEHGGPVFQDSDVYKWLEAVAYTLMWHPDEQLEKTADEMIELIRAAQQPDGYLDTYYILNGLDKRFTNLKDNHELYCLGHMIEAAVAYYQATGKRLFLDTAIAYVNCVYDHIGGEEGKLHGYPGHEIAEMALCRLYEITGDPRQLELAWYFVNQRGQSPLYFKEENEKNGNDFFWKDSYFQYQYYQAGRPVREQTQAEGHAVRAVYLCSGMAEVAAKTGDESLLNNCERLWDNITEKQMYVTGAIGASAYGESFTFDYDLPNDTVYGETCAAIGLVFFARRMFEITKDSRYTDVMERCLYNGVISGMSLDGTKFFYVNPLEVQPEASLKDQGKRHVKVSRQKWFGCACCPPNAARLLASLPGYAIEENEKEVFISLFAGGTADLNINGTDNQLTIETDYPWNGDVNIQLHNTQKTEFAMLIRLPGWCKEWKLLLNGEEIVPPAEKGYLRLERSWENGDRLAFSMEMPVRLVSAHPRVRDDVGKVAVMRGPMVYCLEEADNGDQLQELYLQKQPVFEVKYEKELLGGLVTLTTDGLRLPEEDWEDGVLYREYEPPTFKNQKLKFIPYYSWANREPGEMLVWVKI